MTATSWDDIARRWRELYEQQAEITRNWIDGQAKLADVIAGAGSGEDAGGDTAAMAELWRSWLTLGGSLGLAAPGVATPGRIAGDALGRFLDPLSLTLVGGSQVGETIRRMTEGPRLADLGVIERRMSRIVERWLEVQAAARAYEAVVAGAWMEANKRFASELQERYRAGDVSTQPKDALKVWLDIANQALLETHRSPAFLEAQARLLRNGMDFLLAEREMIESLVEPAGLPTRSEIDEVHRSLQDLKRRVRALEKGAEGSGRAKPVPCRRRAKGRISEREDGDQG